MILLWLLLAPVLLILYLEIKTYRKKKIINHYFQGAKTLPFVGNAHQLGNTPSEILDKMFLWWNEFGKTNYRIWIGYYPNITITDPKDIEFILSSNTLIRKSDVYDMLHPWLGTGLLTSFGSKWHKFRKMITPSFHFKILQDFHETMNENSKKLIKKLQKDAANDNIIDIQKYAHYLTLDVLCDTAMGVHINALEQHDSEIVRAFKDMCYNINMRAFHPIKRKNKLYRFYPDYANYKKTLKVLQDFTYDVIKRRIQALEQGNHPNKNETKSTDDSPKRKMAFLDNLLTATIDNRPLNLDELYEEVSTFMFGGHDTTTSAIAFTVYLLSRHPKIQAKVYEEQLSVVGSDLSKVATFQQISEMQYLGLTIKEAQRIYPSVPIIGRQTEQDYNLNGKIVPEGTTLNLFIMAMGYNEKIFSDPYVARPERFEENSPGPFEFIPFSAGPRNCIGQKFALLEVKTVVSKIVREFEILPPLDELTSLNGELQHFPGLSLQEQQARRTKPDKYDPILSAVLTLKSENGVHIRLRKRK